MGMHFGVIAAKSSWPDLLTSLSQRAGTFERLGPVDGIGRTRFRDGEDEIIAGEGGGGAFAMDSVMVLATSFDSLVMVSRDLGSLVVGAVGETTSGTFGLLVADNGELIRFHWHCQSVLTCSLDLGAALPCEAVVPIHHIDGRGLFEVMRQFGLDFDAWYDYGSKSAFAANELPPEGEPGRLERALNEHDKLHQIPEDRRLSPTVVSQQLPDGSWRYDIVASGLQSPQSHAKPREPWLRRLWTRLTK